MLVVSFQLWISPHNPPGFLDDEASFALTGYTLAHELSDQNGARLPVLFPSFGDYKSATFSYALAPAIAVFGPSDGVARAVAAGLTPWLFQLGRAAFDTSVFPFAVALVLFTTDVWARGTRRLLARSIVLGASLALLTYTYSAGRLYGPLLAAALVLFVRRVPWRSLVAVWATYAVCLIPLGSTGSGTPPGSPRATRRRRFRCTGWLCPGSSVMRSSTICTT